MGSHTNRPPPADVQSVLDGIRRLVQFLRLSGRAAERAGVSAAQLFVLQKLAEAPALSVNELAARTLTHQSSVSVVVQRLEERGLVARKRAGSDGRRVEVSLTRRGRQSLQRTPDASQSRLIAALGKLPLRERRSLAGALRGLLRVLDISGAAPPPMFFEEPPARRRAR
jgi:DNA-binding MarR family transcriptional regulator